MKKLIILLGVLLLAACTSVSIETPTGVKIVYRDFHPASEAVEIDADWQGIGTVRTRRQSDDVTEIIEAAIKVIGDAVNPLSI